MIARPRSVVAKIVTTVVQTAMTVLRVKIVQPLVPVPGNVVLQASRVMRVVPKASSSAKAAKHVANAISLIVRAPRAVPVPVSRA
jgi:hypothetical protein